MKKITTRLTGILKGKIASNALSLYAVQGVHYLLTLVVLPFLLRALSPQGYGSIMFAQSLIAFAEILTDFGFNFTAARDISIARNDQQAIARIYWTTTAAKLLLLMTSLVIIALVVFFTPRFRESWPIFAASTLILFGNVAFPKWYFQGLENLKDVALVQIIAKCVGTASVIFLVHSADDVLIAAIILSSPMLIGAIATLLMGKPLAPALFYLPKIKDIQVAMKQSWHLFVASMSTSLYMNTNGFVLGLMCGETAVGLYSLSARILATIQAFAIPFTQSVFPRASHLFAEHPESGWILVRRVLKLLLPVMTVICLLVAIAAPLFVQILGGKEYADAVTSLRIMSIVPILITVDKVLSEIVMVNVGLSEQLPRIYMIIGVINLMLLWPLIHFYVVNGAAVSLVISETVALFLMIYSIKKMFRSGISQ